MMLKRNRPLLSAVPGLPLALLLVGCGRSPSFNVLGSYFPSWLACAVSGILAAAALGFLLRHLNLEERITVLPIFYVSMALVIACSGWLIFFE